MLRIGSKNPIEVTSPYDGADSGVVCGDDDRIGWEDKKFIFLPVEM